MVNVYFLFFNKIWGKAKQIDGNILKVELLINIMYSNGYVSLSKQWVE